VAPLRRHEAEVLAFLKARIDRNRSSETSGDE